MLHAHLHLLARCYGSAYVSHTGQQAIHQLYAHPQFAQHRDGRDLLQDVPSFVLNIRRSPTAPSDSRSDAALSLVLPRPCLNRIRRPAAAIHTPLSVSSSTSTLTDSHRLLFFSVTLAKLQKASTSFVMSVSLSVFPHETARLPVEGFSREFIFEDFSNICRGNSSFIKI